MRLDLIKLIRFFQMLENFIGNGMAVFACHPAEAVEINACIVNGHHLGKSQTLAEFKVLDTASGCDVHNACAFVGGNVFPSDDFMLNACLRRDVGEAGFKMIADQFFAL